MRSALAIVALCVVVEACARPSITPRVAPSTRPDEALLILPGFGYGAKGEQAFRALAASARRDGIELFVPNYLMRGGLVDSRSKLQAYLRRQQLDRVARLHVFAFLAGGWTLNPLLQTQSLPNLKTVIYDRSPYQERAPRIADETLHFPAWLRYGSTIFDVARTSYAPLTAPAVNIGIVVETKPTAFVRKRAARARSYGPFNFDCDAFGQPHNDCVYIDMSHDELYVRVAEVWPDIRAFIRTGRFTTAANRTPPATDALAVSRPH